VLVRPKKIKRLKDYVNYKNFKLLRITNSSLRQNVLLKKEKWRKNSKLKWPRSLLRMNVLSR
jgi:hypothetical protein